ncbi:hypothetical protein PGT21_019300 [Puccinia graminis f. sp. tritici]|uniref:Uncharacterized protein n=2 Tax=Puccinia graminis f. sp. tritici TaxID=56615 RepID=A0A5B0P8B5_PUCGR|nr:hypothetical protein PGT21_019300 [Puccinia graminis f. sp. tritici]
MMGWQPGDDILMGLRPTVIEGTIACWDLDSMEIGNSGYCEDFGQRPCSHLQPVQDGKSKVIESLNPASGISSTRDNWSDTQGLCLDNIPLVEPYFAKNAAQEWREVDIQNSNHGFQSR